MEATQILRWQVPQGGTASRAGTHGGVEPLPVVEKDRIAVLLNGQWCLCVVKRQLN